MENAQLYINESRRQHNKCKDLYITEYSPLIVGANFKITMGFYKHKGHAECAANNLIEKLHLRITDKSLKISQKRKKI